MINEAIRKYPWHDSKTRAHDYLLSTTKSIFEEFIVPKKAKLLDAACRGVYVGHKAYKTD